MSPVTRVLIDVDTGIDDALAIYYLAAGPATEARPEIVAAGSVHGNVPAPLAAENTLRVLERVGLDGVPVALGAARPLAQPLHTSEHVHGQDGLGNTRQPQPRGWLAEGSAAEQMVRLARAYPGQLTVLALGPLTNVALALLLEPELPKLLREVVVMGGAATVPGNVTSSAEANIWHDPEAAELVLDAGLQLTLVGLDVTMTALARSDWLDRLAAIEHEVARDASAILGFYADFYERLLGSRACALHDPLAAAIMLDPTLATYQEAPVRVELRGDHTRGATLAGLGPVDPGGPDPRPAVKVAVAADIPAFLDRMMAALAG